MHLQQFKITNPGNLARPWRGNLTIQNKAGFNEYVEMHLGDMAKQEVMIKKFMNDPQVKEMLGDNFITQFLKRDSAQWLQRRPLAIDFANSG
jgi:hypothetical protein